MRDLPTNGPAAEVELPVRLMAWLSPSFPIGGFAYSHGLELAVERGWVSDHKELEAWLSDLATIGSLRTDLILLAVGWRAAAAGDHEGLSAVNDMALALQPSAERHLETLTQGNAFLAAISSAWPAPGVDTLASMSPGVAYPVAVGAAAAFHAIALESTLLGYAVSFVSNLTSAAIRLSVVGQTVAQQIIASLLPRLAAVSHEVFAATLDDLGSATLRSDLASLAHETQYTRLFRS